ncbi:hypothetical protein [Anaeromyxobacter paludicola]|uniref:Tetratricopeptide repeat protein n=1 Tax=Anaeromyxobacter paludicola TaxID=2918171 RepID=A0ABN6N7K4_9BACT|nr:hypothetical protein [Anaeromyxobacter paludicola]BDG09036.1 hypothetical protein AMPC_21490 [Anaeromyxobacter paludicola]
MTAGSPAQPEGRRPPRPGLLLFAVLALVFTSYSGVVRAPFVWDDHLLIESDPRIHAIRPAQWLLEPFWNKGAQLTETAYYRPGVIATFSLEWWLSRGRPWLFHLVNLTAHLATTALLFELVRRRSGPVPAALAAALFGLHPRLTECVAWVSGRTDVFAGFFALAALALHRPGPERGRARWLSAAALFSGLLFKEVALAGLVAVAAQGWARWRRQELAGRRALLDLVPGAVAVAAYVLLRLVATAGAVPVEQPAGINRLELALQATGRYVAMLADPLRPRLQIGAVGRTAPGYAALGALALAAGAALAIRAWRRPPRPELAGALAFAVASIAAVLQVVPLATANVAADRYLYLPVAGLALAAGIAAADLRASLRRPVLAAAACAGLAFAGGTLIRVEDWTDELRLWRTAVATADPGLPFPYVSLGNALYQRGRIEEAAEAYRAAAARASGRFQREALGNYASALADLGRLDEACAQQRQAMAIAPPRPIDHYNLSLFEARRLRFDEADLELRRALELLPGYEDALRGRRYVAEARALADALPPERPGEPTAVRARRAALWMRLGMPRRAGPYFTEVAAAPDAEPQDLLRAAAFLVDQGSVEDARRAVARLQAAGAPPKALARLDAALAARESGQYGSAGEAR